MKDTLAEQLLAKVMNWSPEDIVRERPDLQIMAKYKYDSYQQFFPGMRFVESIAQWLNQFETIDERTIAYNFVKGRLVFCSAAEMGQLVSKVYPDYILPLLLKETTRIISCPEHLITKIAESQEFQVLRRQSLFLSLSDSSHIDLFRRLNREEISHEQIYAFYDISEDKAKDLIDELEKSLVEIIGKKPEDGICRFRNLFLLDDFSGSGKSYLREEENGYSGKIAKVYNTITKSDSPLSKIIDENNLLICTVLYMATEQSIRYLKPLMERLFQDNGYRYKLLSVQHLDESIRVQKGIDDDFLRLVDKYYDPKVETKSTRVGGTDNVKLGFANCALPIVLSHNTPNNSVALLWSYEYREPRGLFPRVTRH